MADVGAVVLLEHLNTNISSDLVVVAKARRWCQTELGATLDPDHQPASLHTLWMSVGPFHQLHLPALDPLQPLQGDARSEVVLSGSFGTDDERVATCPVTGLRYRLVRGPPALRAVRLGANRDALPSIARYWREVMRAPVTEGEQEVQVVVGPAQYLAFYAYDSPANGEDGPVDRWTGYHVCVYSADWEACYVRHQQRGLLYTDHPHNEPPAHTLEVARSLAQFRARDVRDAQGRTVFQLELEVRSMHHKMYGVARHLRGRE